MIFLKNNPNQYVYSINKYLLYLFVPPSYHKINKNTLKLKNVNYKKLLKS